MSRFGGDTRGVAAVEMALVGGVLAGALMNVAEVGRYAHVATQVTAAGQAAAQAALVRCDPDDTPVTLRCDGVGSAVATAIRGTSLGETVTLHGAPSEGWYCVNAQGRLQKVADADDEPGDCEAAGGEGAPGLYFSLQVQHTYEPLFPGLTLAETFPDTIVRSAWMRLK